MTEGTHRQSGPRRPASRTALVLVENAVTGDSRVLRAAGTLRDLGFDVLIAGVITEQEPLTETRIDGFNVIRLARLETLRKRLRPSQSTSPASGAAPARAEVTTGRTRRFAAARRLAWAAAYYVQGIALVRRTSPALVHANDYRTMWIGIAAKLLRHSRLVYDSHELWPDRDGRPEWRPWLVACEWLFVRLADATVASNPAISETLARRYRVPAPTVVRNVSESVVESPRQAEGLQAGAAPLAVYVGSLTQGRGIEQAILALAAAPEFRLRLMGSGAPGFRAHLAQCAAAAGVEDRIEYRPPVEPTAVAEAITGVDMGLLLTQPVCLNNELSLPNKLFEYAAAGLPIVASDLPVIRALVRGEGLGEVVPPDDVDAIAQAMRRLADPERNDEVRERVHSFAARTTWAQERLLLEEVYRGLSSTDHADTHG